VPGSGLRASGVMRRLCAVSVDLDEIPNYFRIHGLPAPPTDASAGRAVYDVALDRMAAFASARAGPLTLFVIRSDPGRRGAAPAIRRLAERGHGVENHSLSHAYDFTRLAPPDIVREVDLGARAIEAAVGRRPTGFRAPGYTVTDAVFDALES